MKQEHIPQKQTEFRQDSTHRNGLRSLLNVLMVLVAILTLSATTTRGQVLTNWLNNPGFEANSTTPPAGGWANIPPWGWVAYGSFTGIQNTNGFVYPSTTIHVTAHGGTNVLKIYGYNQPYTVPAGLQETFTCAPGSTWTADGWLNTQMPDVIRSNSTAVAESAFFEVLFMDVTTNYSAPLATFYSQALTTNMAQSTWWHMTVTNATGGTTLTAPAGTAFIRYECIFSQPSGYPGGSCYFDDVQLIRTSRPDPEITVQPVPVTKVYGQTATFSVTADGQSALSYQWLKNGANVTDPNASGASTSTLTLTAVTTANLGNFSVRVTDSAGNIESTAVGLNVLDPGVISITPALGQTKVVGSNVTMSVVAAGSGSLNYSWQKDGVALANNGHYTGVTTPTLTINSVTTADAGTSTADTSTYSCQVNFGAASASTGLKVITAAQATTNIIANPGFEDGIWTVGWESAWSSFNGAGISSASDNYYNTTTPVSVYDGVYVARTYAGGADDGIYSGAIPVTAGTTYHAGGKFYISSLDQVTDPSWGVFQVFFKDATGTTILSCNSRHMAGSASTNNSIFPVDTWTSVIATNGADGELVAPAGTVTATVQIYQYCQIGGGGSVWFDDLYLTPVATTPTPPPPFSVSATYSSGTINLSFLTANGASYDVQYSSNPTTPLASWTTLTTIVGDGTVRSVPDTTSAGTRYYCVKAHNP